MTRIRKPSTPQPGGLYLAEISETFRYRIQSRVEASGQLAGCVMGTLAIIPRANDLGRCMFADFSAAARQALKAEGPVPPAAICPDFRIATVAAPFASLPQGNGTYRTLETDMLVGVGPEPFSWGIDRALILLTQQIAEQLEPGSVLHTAVTQLVAVESATYVA